MSMNIHGLGASEAVLQKPESSEQTYKLSNQFNADIQKAKEDGQIKDLLQLSGVDATEFFANSTGEVKRTGANYSLETFFRKDMPQLKDGDGNYTVSNVKFSEEELTVARNMMNAAFQGINGEQGQKLTLDYMDYASMKLAENAVATFAKENFNEEQQNVMIKAMKEYTSALEKQQENFLSNGSFVDNHYKGVSDYYGKSHVYSEEEVDPINQLKDEMSKMTGKTYKKAVAGQYEGTVQVATNQKLIGNIKDLFEKVDLNDKDSVKNMMEQYKKLLTPAYQASGISNQHNHLNDVIGKDTNGFMSMIENMKASASYKSFNFTV